MFTFCLIKQKLIYSVTMLQTNALSIFSVNNTPGLVLLFLSSCKTSVRDNFLFLEGLLTTVQCQVKYILGGSFADLFQSNYLAIEADNCSLIGPSFPLKEFLLPAD